MPVPAPPPPPPPPPQKAVTWSGRRRKLLIAAAAAASVIGAATYGTISGFTGPSPGQGTPAAASMPSPDPGAARKIAYQMMPSLGFNQTTQYSCLVALWDKLSGWDVYAGSESAGYGIPQATPGDIMASAGPHWRTDAATQIKWGLGYIKETYDTPCGAWQYLKSHGFY
jgi:hypothetical protein